MIGRNNIDNEIIDTLTLARDKYPGSQVNLDSLCKRFRIDNSKRTHHTALIDCDLLAKVYINLIDQKEPSLDFLSKNEGTNNSKINKAVNYSKKIIKINEEELKLHKVFLKNHLKKNYF